MHLSGRSPHSFPPLSTDTSRRSVTTIHLSIDNSIAESKPQPWTGERLAEVEKASLTAARLAIEAKAPARVQGWLLALDKLLTDMAVRYLEGDVLIDPHAPTPDVFWRIPLRIISPSILDMGIYEENLLQQTLAKERRIQANTGCHSGFPHRGKCNNCYLGLRPLK